MKAVISHLLFSSEAEPIIYHCFLTVFPFLLAMKMTLKHYITNTAREFAANICYSVAPFYETMSETKVVQRHDPHFLTVTL